MPVKTRTLTGLVQFETISDLWRAAIWMEQQRQAGQQRLALSTFMVEMTRSMRQAIDRYERAVVYLDKFSNGIISSPTAAKMSGLPLPAGANLLTNMQAKGKLLRRRLDTMLEGAGTDLDKQWNAILAKSSSYAKFVTELVQDFGNFEVFLTSLPGTGDVITDTNVQQCLKEMFKINTRHIRVMEFIHDIYKYWRNSPPLKTMSLFHHDVNYADLVKQMLLEYVHEGDTARIAEKFHKAKEAGKPFIPYRFSRPAACLVQLAGVRYSDDQDRTPDITRQYTVFRKMAVPPIWGDLQRLEWALKEIYNNAVAATCTICMKGGKIVATPLKRHNVQYPSAAIKLSLQILTDSDDAGRRMMRLTIADEGVGMSPDTLKNASLWGYSTKREEFRKFSSQKHPAGAQQPVFIGWKGIGIPYATSVLKEHGGRLTIISKRDAGTVVHMDLPAPSNFTTDAI